MFLDKKVLQTFKNYFQGTRNLLILRYEILNKRVALSVIYRKEAIFIVFEKIQCKENICHDMKMREFLTIYYD